MSARRVSAWGIVTVAILATVFVLPVAPARGAVITDADIVPTPWHVVHAGNGQLDLILFNFANGSGVNGNELKDQGTVIFNGDNANTDTPVGTGNPVGASASESYITSIGDLRGFYRTTFPDGQGGSIIDEIVLFVDLCETGQGVGGNTNDYITLNTLNILVNYTPFPGTDIRNDPWGNDLDCDTQNGTGSGFTGGTTVAELASGVAPRTLAVNSNGSGWADHMIFTGINPFDGAFTDETPILFFWESIEHEGGGTDIFLSGSVIPEPGTMVVLALGGMGVLLRRRRIIA